MHKNSDFIDVFQYPPMKCRFAPPSVPCGRPAWLHWNSKAV